MKFTLNINYLAAALKVAPRNASDAAHRTYLVGVHFDMDARTLVATDGHALIALADAITATDEGVDDEGRAVPGTLEAHGPFILNYEACRELIKTAKDCRITCAELELTSGPNLESLTFTTASGPRSWYVDNTSQFPDWRRSVPRSLALEGAQFNPDLLVTLRDAFALANPRRKGVVVATQLHTDTENTAAVMTCNATNIIGVVMPWRSDAPEHKPAQLRVAHPDLVTEEEEAESLAA